MQTPQVAQDQEKGPKTIKINRLAALLAGYPKVEAACYFLNGFWNGFRIPAPPPRLPSWAENLKSGMESVVRQKINKELKVDRVAGNFASCPI